MTTALLCATLNLAAISYADEAATPETASAQTRHSLHVGVDIGYRQLQLAGIDAVPAYYNIKQYGFDRDPAGIVWETGVRVGFDLTDKAFLEWGATIGPNAYNESFAVAGPDMIRTSAKSALSTGYLMSAYRLENSLLGLRLGWAIFNSKISADSPNLGQLGDYRQEANTLYGGPVWRMQPVEGMWPVSIEFSYDFLRFDQVANLDRKGSFSNIPATGKNPNGTDTTIDFSALKFKIGWEFSMPMAKN